MALILVADDNESLRRVVKRLLVGAGHDVLEAADGNETLRLLDGAAPALVITDLVMPGKEGIETIIDIRRRGIAIKILAMTGSDPADNSIYLDAARKLGADDVLHKPFRAAELVEAVERLLDPAG